MQADETRNTIQQLRQSIQASEQQLRQADEQRRKYEREAKEQIRQLQSAISDKKRNLGVLNSLESKVQRGDSYALHQWRRLVWRM